MPEVGIFTLLLSQLPILPSGSVPSVGESIAALTRGMFPKLLAGFFFASFVPSPVIYLAGNGGAPLLAGIAPLLLTLAMGLLSISWGVLLAILWPLGKMAQVLGPKRYASQSDGNA